MACGKKGSCKEGGKKEEHVEKLTDETLDGVSGGSSCRPWFTPDFPCDPKIPPMPCFPKIRSVDRKPR